MKWHWIKLLFLLILINFPSFLKGEATFSISDSTRFQRGVVNLNTVWDFYWKEFVDPVDLDCSGEPIKIVVPGYWKGNLVNNEKLPGIGYGTYLLRVILPPDFRKPMAVYFPSVDVAYKLFIDGTLAHQCGVPSNSIQNEVPQYRPKLINFQPKSDTISFLLQVSNFNHRRGGIWEIPFIGEKTKADQLMNSRQISEVVVLSVLFSFGIFFLIFSFFYYKKEKALLFFALTIILVFFRGISINQVTLALMSELPWHYVVRTEYASIFGCLLCGVWGFHYLVPIKWIFKTLKVISYGLIAVFLMIGYAPVGVFSYTIFVFYAFLGIGALFFSIQLMQMKQHTSRFSAIYIVSLALLLLGAVHDALVSNSFVFTLHFYILPFVFIVFILAQSIEFFKRFAYAMKRSEELSLELSALNENLEEKIVERTLELNSKNQIIESQNKILKQDIFFKNRLLSVMGHDIRSPLASIIQGLEIVTNETSSDENRFRIAKKIKVTSNSLFILIENLLSWGLSQNGQLRLKPEMKLILPVIRSIKKQIFSLADDKHIEVSINVPANIEAWFDETSVAIIIRNLLANAIKFTPEYGNVSISAEREGSFAAVSVTDTGVGLSDEAIAKILSGENNSTTEGTNQEKGTGLGLMMCLELIRMNNGKLSIRSKPGQGSNFSFSLPTSPNISSHNG